MYPILNKINKELIFGVYEVSKTVLILGLIMSFMGIEISVIPVVGLGAIIYVLARIIVDKKEKMRWFSFIAMGCICAYIYFFIKCINLFSLIILFLFSLILFVRILTNDRHEKEFSAFKFSFWRVNILYALAIIVTGQIGDLYYKSCFIPFIVIMLVSGMLKIMFLNISLTYERRYINESDYERHLFRFTIFNFLVLGCVLLFLTISNKVIDGAGIVSWILENIVITVFYPVLYVLDKISQLSSKRSISTEISEEAIKSVDLFDPNMAYTKPPEILLFIEILKWSLIIGIVYFILKFIISRTSDKTKQDADSSEEKSYLSKTEIVDHYINMLKKSKRKHKKSNEINFFRYYWEMVGLFKKTKGIDYDKSETSCEYQQKIKQKANEDIEDMTQIYNDLVYGGKIETKEFVDLAKNTTRKF